MVNNRLTEQLVESRSKCSDFRQAVKLNAWGSDLDDISICLDMPRLEVLALSVNKINTLSSLKNCHELKELYLRKNEIPDFSELNYLKNARNLTSLWLEGNPCSDAAGSEYRACVLRMLPQIKKLDNIEVTDKELQAALRHERYTVPRQSEPAKAPEPVNPKRAAAQARREEREREREREEEIERERERVATSIANIGSSNCAQPTSQRQQHPTSRRPAEIALALHGVPSRRHIQSSNDVTNILGHSCVIQDQSPSIQAQSPSSAQAVRVQPDLVVDVTSRVNEVRRCMQQPPQEFHGDHAHASCSSAATAAAASAAAAAVANAARQHVVHSRQRNAVATAATAAAAAAAAAAVAQVRQETTENLQYHPFGGLPPGDGDTTTALNSSPPSSTFLRIASGGSARPLTEGRLFELVAAVPPQAPQPPLNVTNSSMYFPAGSAGGLVTATQTQFDVRDPRRGLRRNANLLSSALCLIREMDATSLEVLSNAIHDHVLNNPQPNDE
ncbi:hormone receptor 4 [Scaptodrosophila lebanonensis]|uniref:Hormone receptor 4 n=1 Tax=Drosophila lebanonensis TaxID=7225 RepID=A0A6J2U0K1_DROLE|nr:hormone receptor 4 [Scaptodrosophila lebanonensis]